MLKRTPLWRNIALVVVAVVVPFGTVLVLVATAMWTRSELRRRAENKLEGWWRSRTLARASSHASPSR
jgi:hypothetical protein